MDQYNGTFDSKTKHLFKLEWRLKYVLRSAIIESRGCIKPQIMYIRRRCVHKMLPYWRLI